MFLGGTVGSVLRTFASGDKRLSYKKLKSYEARADVIAQDSHDLETKVGAILIHPRSGAVMSEGFNGFVRGAPDNRLPRTRPGKYRYMQHAEMNMLCNAARHGVATEGCIVFSTLSPCTDCLRMMYQAGICTVVFRDTYGDFYQSLSMGDIDVQITRKGEFTVLRMRPRR